jgi:hypothetical protein
MPATHPLAEAARRAGRATDVVLAAEALGQMVDAQMAALAPLASTDDSTRTALRTAFAVLNRTASYDPLVPWPAEQWYRSHVRVIQLTAARCGFSTEDWVADVRAPAWTPL